jgi:flagellar hook-associated protein 2
MSSVSRTRATNLTGLIDIDALVEANLIRQKTKLNTSTQKLKVEQYRQEQYREVITKSKNFYNKYCDILSGGSLLNSSSYNSIKYSSSNSNLVTATGSSTSNVENYKINVEQLATSAKVELKDTELSKGKEILINGKTFTIKGENTSEIAKNLNADLKESGLNITAKYSQFANSTNGGFVIETKETGEGAGLNIGLNTTKIEVIAGKNATVAAKSESITKDELTANNEIIVNGNTITLEGDTVEKKNRKLKSILKRK